MRKILVALLTFALVSTGASLFAVGYDYVENDILIDAGGSSDSCYDHCSGGVRKERLFLL